jgi:hypothetical protein
VPGDRGIWPGWVTSFGDDPRQVFGLWREDQEGPSLRMFTKIRIIEASRYKVVKGR